MLSPNPSAAWWRHDCRLNIRELPPETLVCEHCGASKPSAAKERLEREWGDRYEQDAKDEALAASSLDWYSVQAGFWRSLWLVLCGGRLREWKQLPVGSVEDLLDEDDYAVMRIEEELGER